MDKREFKYSSSFYYRVAKTSNEYCALSQRTHHISSDVINEIPSSIDEHHLDNPDSTYIENWIDLIESDSDDSETYEDGEDEHNNEDSFQDQLAGWIITNGITHAASNQLLKLLKTKECLKNLPSDVRTIVKTPRNVRIEKMGSGEFWYNSIESTLISHFKTLAEDTTISLQFHIDGLQFAKSTKTHFWPVLFRIIEKPKIEPQVAAIYCGESKPESVHHYLNYFVGEMNNLVTNGIIINTHKLNVTIHSFVCDSPARSFVKGIVYFNHYSGCSKCTVSGSFFDCMVFTRIDAVKRDDSSFRSRREPEHHKTTSPLENLPIDMVEHFPVSDNLHLFDLGIMKRQLEGWTTGKFNYRTKWSNAQITEICQLLKFANESRPIELHRQIRTLRYLSIWKGTEYRTFLLYLGIVILKDFLKPNVYYHFSLLFCAYSIYSARYYQKYRDIAHELIEEYVKSYSYFYGPSSVVSNVHNLIHVIDDVRLFGELENISTYPFESYLGIFKKLVRSGNRPLAQVAKRFCEISTYKNKKKEETKNYPILTREGLGVTFELEKGFTLKNDHKNKWFLSAENEIVEMINVNYFNDELKIVGDKLVDKANSFFTNPIDSSFLNIYSVENINKKSRKHYRLEDVKCKLFQQNYRSMNVFLPILHTLK
ncbi:uncharacterized protein LOC129789619 [Lutzomyia longipalpis]|uniref:uncharacterized protein LOC129789619 n=1 Tax=Lutzomyia longipalpis TaxID=7200 RepID=UPI002483FEA2|nr:uncharacterized protein LOC129789619 [Lutzomyia longipalpis]